MTDKLAQAVRELGVNVPVLRAEPHGNGLKLWLYGGRGEPVIWEPKSKKAETKPQPARTKAKTTPARSKPKKKESGKK